MDGRRSPGDRLAMLGRRQPRPDLVRLARAQTRGRDLRDLVLEQVHPPGQLARVDRELGQRRTVRPPALDDIGHRRPRRAMPAVCVEQVALPALVEQPLLVVLAVDLDERPDLVGEPRRGRGEVVEPGRRSAARRHLAHRDERLGQPVEQRLDPRDVGAVTDQTGVRPGATDEPEGVDQEALPGARLAGDHVEPRTERQAQPVDEREIAHRQLEESPGGHDGSSATLWRSRSQNGWAPSGRDQADRTFDGPDLDDVADLDRRCPRGHRPRRAPRTRRPPCSGLSAPG